MTDPNGDGDSGLRELFRELRPVTDWGASTDPLPLDGRLLAFCCDETAFRSLLRTLEGEGDHPQVVAVLDTDITSILGTHGRKFELATRTQELVDEGSLRLGETQVSPRLPEVVGDTEAGITLETGFDTTAVRSTLSPDLRRHLLQHVREASLVSVYAPGRSELVARFTDEFGTDATDDLQYALEEATTRTGQSVDPASVLALIAARHDIPLRDLSLVAEELNISSANTLSRRVNSDALDGVLDEGTFDTEFGRPPKRLQLVDEYADASLDDLLRFAV
ncbi:MAG: DUF5821 family protein [Halobaculum sp.]|jgi:hypothetical protein